MELGARSVAGRSIAAHGESRGAGWPRVRRSAFIVAAFMAVVGAYVTLRWAQVQSTGHLSFHLDRGEYGILLSVARFARWDTTFLLTDPLFAPAFFTDSIALGDTGTHGTLVPTTAVIHALVTDGPLDYSTRTLRVVGLSTSTLALVAWLLLIGWRWRAPGLAGAFALFWVFAPAPWVKLNTLCWGTHEQIVGLFAMVALGGASFRARRGSDWWSMVGLGVAGGLAVLLNTLLLLPILWLVVARVIDGLGGAGRAWSGGSSQKGGGSPHGFVNGAEVAPTGPLSRLGHGLLRVVFALTGGSGVLWLLLQWPVLEKVRTDPVARRFDRVAALVDGGFVRLPDGHGVSTLLTALTPLTPGLLAAVAVVIVVIRRRSWGQGLAERGSAWAALTLLLSVLALAFAPPAYDERGTFVMRYLCHLYPFAFIVLGAVVLGLVPVKLLVRSGIGGMALLLGIWTNGPLVDFGNLRAGDRWDGVLPFAIANEEGNNLPLSRSPHGAAPLDFHLGAAHQLSTLQSMDYFYWRTPRSMNAAAVGEGVSHSVAMALTLPAGPRRRDALRGVGFAASVQVPPQRRAALLPSWVGPEGVPLHPEDERALEEGYQLPDDYGQPRGDEPILQRVREGG